MSAWNELAIENKISKGEKRMVWKVKRQTAAFLFIKLFQMRVHVRALVKENYPYSRRMLI